MEERKSQEISEIHFVPNNFNNKIAGAPRYSSLTGQPPQYSNKEISAIQIYYEINNLDLSSSEQNLEMPTNVHPLLLQQQWS